MIYLPASLVAGALWTASANLAFALAAALSLAAIASLIVLRPSDGPTAVPFSGTPP